MTLPVTYSLEVEEALVASLLLHDEFKALREFRDDEVWYSHLRPVLAAIRKLHDSGKPAGTVFVLRELEPILDGLSWRGESGEVMLMSLLSRHVHDVQAFYGPALGNMVHNYAERRLALQRARGAAQEAFDRAMQTTPVVRSGFLDGD